VKTRHITLFSGLALLATTVVQIQGQDVQDRTTYVIGDRGDSVSNGNRASRIVGMQVQNYQNQDLGRVDDVVFNLQSGRIAYVVLSVPTSHGDQLVAVPPNALLPSAQDSSRLVLNMDRSRLDRVQGFTRDNWPDPNRPFVGSETLWGYASPPPPPTAPPPPPPSDRYPGEHCNSPRAAL
jgi:sporulation protein YlmC with PRC-barrel domain